MDKKNNDTFQDKGWDNMKLILDKEMPEKKRRVIPFFWLLSSVAASIVLIFAFKGNLIDGHSSQKIDKTHLNIAKAEQNDISPNRINQKVQTEKVGIEMNDVNDSQNFEKNQGTQLQDLGSNNENSKTKTTNFAYAKQKKTVIPESQNTIKLSSNIQKVDIASLTEEKSSNNKSKEISASPNAAKIDLSINEGSKNVLNNRSSVPQEVSKPSQEVVSKHDSDITSIIQEKAKEATTPSIPKNIDYIKNNSLTENISNNLVEASATTVFKAGNNEKFALELGGEYGFPLKTYSINLGARYQIFEQSKLNAFIGVGGFFSPTEVGYSSILYTKDTNSFLTQSKINSTIDQLVGARLFAQSNFNLSRGQGFYTHLKGGLQYLRLLESSENQESLAAGVANTPGSTSRDQSTTVEVTNNPFNLFGQIGLGYRINKLGIEMYYGLSQNTFRGSPLQGINQKLNHGIGGTALWYF